MTEWPHPGAIAGLEVWVPRGNGRMRCTQLVLVVRLNPWTALVTWDGQYVEVRRERLLRRGVSASHPGDNL
jgi:hypothetical protein